MRQALLTFVMMVATVFVISDGWEVPLCADDVAGVCDGMTARKRMARRQACSPTTLEQESRTGRYDTVAACPSAD